MTHAILIVEDDLTFATMLKTWLGKKGFEVETTGTNARARKLIAANHYHLILSDLRLPDQDGIHLLGWMKEQNINVPLIIMTSYGDIRSAVEAMKCGAIDYIAKPVQPDELLKKMNDAISGVSLEAAAATPAPSVAPAPKSTAKAAPKSEGGNSAYLEGNSEAAQQLYKHVALVAPTAMTVLINGASGTGKEYVARRIHQLSKRADKPFVAIDCGSIPKELAASEFFGHIKGSFTGAMQDKTGAFVEANGGTLFLDEVGNLSYEVQIQLLRALQERRIRPVGSTKEIEVDIRVISATNENLPLAIEQSTFREDLYHRLNEFILQMPALCQRKEDIMLFANLFLDQANRDLDRQLVGFDAEAVQVLQNYGWPGNLREMKNVVKRATLLAQGSYITRADLDAQQLSSSATAEAVTAPLFDVDGEKEKICKALAATNNNKSKAATLLGIDRKTLYNKLKLYDIQ